MHDDSTNLIASGAGPHDDDDDDDDDEKTHTRHRPVDADGMI